MQPNLFGAPPLPARPAPRSRPIDEPAPATPSRLAGLTTPHAKREARAAVRAIQAGTLGARLLALYARAHRGEHADRQGRRWSALTDYEAAAELGVERTSINAARATLVRDGLVTKSRKRKCRYKPSSFDVWAWEATEKGMATAGEVSR